MSKSYRDFFPVISRSSALAGMRAAEFSAEGSLTVSNCADLMLHERLALVQQKLTAGLHGLSFSPYLQGQAPGQHISAEQIRERLSLISPHCRWIRTFSCLEGNEQTPAIAHELGLKVMVGVGLGEDPQINERELASGLALAKEGHADILAVGNEVLLRGDLTEDELLAMIEHAKAEVPDVTVGYVDAYFLFENHPRIAQACDALLINCYPFWECCPVQYGVAYMQQMYERAKAVAQGKPVIISETGWPTDGAPYGDAEPGFENALDYFLESVCWAEEQGIELFYFSSFDETWKVGDEGDVGAFWGIWDEHGRLKFV